MAELDAVLASPAFARSPVLSRLLGYLVEESIAGRAGRLKSYTVAVDGLGRESGHDPQLDTYSRVAMVRLRRALDAFYQRDERRGTQRLQIPLGSYEVVLEDAAKAGTAPVPKPASRPAATLRRYRWPILIVVLALALALLAGQWLYNRSLREAATWQQINFPSVLVTMNGSVADPAMVSHREIAEFFRETIRPYESVRIANELKNDITHIVDLRLEQAAGGERSLGIKVTNLKLNRVIYEADIPGVDPDQLDETDRLMVRRAIYAVFSYSGRIATLDALNSMGPDTPYECKLRFNQLVGTDPMFTDPEMTACARSWHKHAPQRPMATFVFAWTEVNSALGSFSGSTRDRKLRQTMQLLEGARARNPNSRHLALALARTYAFLGYRESVRETVKGLTSPEHPNPEFANLAGTFMLLQNDPDGETLVDESLAFHPDPPSRYFLGKFLAAMMRDDIAGSGDALDHMLVENRSSLWGQVFQAAYLARTGNVPAAKAAWQLAVSQRPALGISPRLFISASPASSEVEARLLVWLGPVID